MFTRPLMMMELLISAGLCHAQRAWHPTAAMLTPEPGGPSKCRRGVPASNDGILVFHRCADTELREPCRVRIHNHPISMAAMHDVLSLFESLQYQSTVRDHRRYILNIKALSNSCRSPLQILANNGVVQAAKIP